MTSCTPRSGFKAAILLLAGLSGACTPVPASVPAFEVPPIRGIVEFPAVYRTRAGIDQVAKNATVSFIDPDRNQTLGTALTDTVGAFTLNFLPKPTLGQMYYVEAVKGLNSNAVGSDAARVRTLIRWSGTKWEPLNTGPTLFLSKSTTALCAIASLRHLSVSDQDKLVGKLDLGTPSGASPDTFREAGTVVTVAEFLAVRDLVDTALASDADPLDAVTYTGITYQLKPDVGGAATNPAIYYLEPNIVEAGDTVTIYGISFLAGPTVTFQPGIAAAVSSATSDTIKVTVPNGAKTGNMTVSMGDRQLFAPITVVPRVGGGLAP
jgi:hypothetical protein